MCGRFAQLPLQSPNRLPWPALADAFAALPARYNLAPGQNAGVVIHRDGQTELANLHWGLLPFWAKELSLGSHTFNARLETVDEKPAFRAAFKARHAAIPMAGYYEWKTTPGGKQPYFIHPEHTADTLWIAGLWEPRHALQTDTGTGSFTLITQPAEGIPAEVHSRMPVFLEQRDVEDWLGLARGPSMPFLLTRSLPALKTRPVAKRVNKGVDDDAGLLEPIALQ